MKRPSILAILTLASLMFVGCGGGTKSGTPSTPPPPPPPPANESGAAASTAATWEDANWHAGGGAKCLVWQ
jgi:hypothetical protein